MFVELPLLVFTSRKNKFPFNRTIMHIIFSNTKSTLKNQYLAVQYYNLIRSTNIIILRLIIKASVYMGQKY